MIHSWPQELRPAERAVSLNQSTSSFVSSTLTHKRSLTSFTEPRAHSERSNSSSCLRRPGRPSVFFLGVSLSTTRRLCSPLRCTWGRTIGRRFDFSFLFTRWKLLLLPPAKKHPSQGVLKGSESHSSILCHHHGYLYGHEEDSVKEHEIMLWDRQVPGVLEGEHNWESPRCPPACTTNPPGRANARTFVFLLLNVKRWFWESLLSASGFPEAPLWFFTAIRRCLCWTG